MTVTALARRRTIDDVEHDIVAAAAHINRAMYAFLVLVREYDERQGYRAWGHRSCAEWLHWRCDLGLNAARERVRVAHALAVLPQMSEALARGTLSYSKVRALTRVATPENEAALLAFAFSTTTARVEERVCQMRNASRASTAEAAKRHAERALRVFRDLNRGTMTITVEIPLEQGELVCRALDKAVQSAPEPGPELRDTPWLARQADALVEIAQRYLAGGEGRRCSTADHYQVVVHVDAAALKGGEGRSDLPIETVRRLTCDCAIVEVVDGEDGEPLSVGRKRRLPPTGMKRALWSRDRGCVFPGCSNRHYLASHHVQHWTDGGPTSVDNLLLLCSAHHRLVHEGGFEVVKDHQGNWRFRRPDGRMVPEHGYRPEDVTDDIENPPRGGLEERSLCSVRGR